MKTYRITETTQGDLLGYYEGETPQDALENMAKTSGYEDFYHVAAAAAKEDTKESIQETMSQVEAQEYHGCGVILPDNRVICERCLGAWATEYHTVFQPKCIIRNPDENTDTCENCGEKIPALNQPA